MSDWEILNTEIPYKNKWIEVRHNEVVNPSGGKGIYGTVHFENVAAAILPIDNEGFTYLVGQYRFPLNEYSWELPMGGVPLGTHVLAGAQRELLEETGLVASQWTEIAKIHTSNSVTDEVAYAFVAQGLSQQSTEPEATENLAIKKIPIQEALDMALKGQITDSISLITIFKAALIYKW
jgi:ADP-ribose pyrophosphatase